MILDNMNSARAEIGDSLWGITNFICVSPSKFQDQPAATNATALQSEPASGLCSSVAEYKSRHTMDNQSTTLIESEAASVLNSVLTKTCARNETALKTCKAPTTVIVRGDPETELHETVDCLTTTNNPPKGGTLNLTNKGATVHGDNIFDVMLSATTKKEETRNETSYQSAYVNLPTASSSKFDAFNCALRSQLRARVDDQFRCLDTELESVSHQTTNVSNTLGRLAQKVKTFADCRQELDHLARCKESKLDAAVQCSLSASAEITHNCQTATNSSACAHTMRDPFLLPNNVSKIVSGIKNMKARHVDITATLNSSGSDRLRSVENKKTSAGRGTFANTNNRANATSVNVASYRSAPRQVNAGELRITNNCATTIHSHSNGVTPVLKRPSSDTFAAPGAKRAAHFKLPPLRPSPALLSRFTSTSEAPCRQQQQQLLQQQPQQLQQQLQQQLRASSMTTATNDTVQRNFSLPIYLLPPNQNLVNLTQKTAFPNVTHYFQQFYNPPTTPGSTVSGKGTR